MPRDSHGRSLSSGFAGTARPRLGLALVLASAAVGCVTNPVTQQTDVVFVREADEVRLGNEAAAKVAEEVGIVSDPRLTATVARVGRRVAASAPERSYDYSFEIVDLAPPNAFALPGGHVYVSRGLLALVDSEDELANVLAHEVIHVAARHHAQRQARTAGVGLFALPGLLVGSAIGGRLGQAVIAPFEVAGAGVIASHSRSQEFEADDYGQRLSASAGYDPGALATFLATLERERRLGAEEAREPSWFDSHPSTPRRASEAAKRAQLLPADGVGPAADREAFLQRFDGLLVGDDPAEGVFDGRRFLHPDLDFTIVVPEGWKVSNTRRAVGAIEAGGSAQVVLRQQEKGNDAREAANGFLAETRKHVQMDVARMDAVELNGRIAVHALLVARAPRGDVILDLTWIPHGGFVYLLSGTVAGGYSDVHRATFAAVARSFVPLGSVRRAGIQETRLRLRTVRAGESLADFGRRAGNAWDPERTAVLNGIPENAQLREGQLLKVAIPQPYRPRVQ
ncbi:MAG: M48 family metalloprotease [Myxococcota bacterium]|jgi:predicted Zn-dependent protease|nr:M48 family metalloprotease [Myxococcota bacterium]MDP7075414.1 M48 family metalloprotease [Myxococcota bacterium]MDP7433494.1 M48 family metalloprotease [Myxococcota bacterium]